MSSGSSLPSRNGVPLNDSHPNGSVSPSASSSSSAAPSSTTTSTNAPSSVSCAIDTESVPTTTTTTSASTKHPGDGTQQNGVVRMDTTNAPAASSASTHATAMDIDQSVSTGITSTHTQGSTSTTNHVNNSPAAPMDIDSTASSSSSSSTPASSSAALAPHLASIEASPKNAEGVLKNLLKMLQTLRKNPNLIASRKFRCDNIAVRKFVIDSPGALEIAKFVGFQQLELTDKKIPYLVAEESVVTSTEGKARLDAAIDVLQVKVTALDNPATAAAAAAAKPVVKGEPKMCVGGCGFCGSPDTEDYCSVCFKKRFLSSGSALTSPSKPSSVANDPFVTPPKPAARPAVAAAPAVAAGSSTIGVASSTEVKPKPLAKRDLKRWRCLFDGAMVKVRAIVRFNAGKKPVQENKNRCWTCQKKIGITGFECRCRYVFCAQHRYMEQHDCRYDIKSLHRKKLKKENEEIRAAKIIKL